MYVIIISTLCDIGLVCGEICDIIAPEGRHSVKRRWTDMDENLSGNYLVRAGRWAFQEAHRWLPRARDRAELRRHALKLRFWPTGQDESDGGELCDLDWSWIKALPELRIGELRVHDTLGGCDNLRIIFFDPKKAGRPLPTLWVVSVLQKKRDDFTKAQLANYRMRRKLILERFYDNP